MKALVLLNGCGHQDGSEVQESVLTLLALSTEGIFYDCASLDENQSSVMNHKTSEEIKNEKRNMLAESARIARGQVKNLAEVDLSQYDALLIPGGFGTAKNFCNYASAGMGMEVHSKIIATVKYFYENTKPIGAICISPVLVAKCLEGKNLQLTSGNDPVTAEHIEKWGHRHVGVEKGSCAVDKENKVLSTPAYMYSDSKITEIYQGIHCLVTNLKTLVRD